MSYPQFVPRTAVTSSFVEGKECRFLTCMDATKINSDLAKSNPAIFGDITPNGNSRLIAAASNPDHNIKLYLHNDTSDTLTFFGNLSGHTAPIHDVVFGHMNEHPNILVSAAEDGYIAAWDVRSGKNIMNFNRPNLNGKMYSCDIRGNTVLAGGEKGIYFYDIRNAGLLTFSDSSHTDEVTQVRFHPTNTNLVFSGSEDMLINVYDLTLGSLNSLEDLIDNTLPTEQPVAKFGFFGPEHQYLWAISPIETLSLWNIDECEMTASYSGIRDSINQTVVTALGFDRDAFFEEGMDDEDDGMASNNESEEKEDEMFVPASFDESESEFGAVEHAMSPVNGCDTYAYNVSSQFSTDLISKVASSSPKSISKMHPSMWRVDNLIKCEFSTQTGALRLVSGTIGGGLIISDLSPKTVTPFCLMPPGVCHNTRVRDCIWGGEKASLITCAQDSRLALWTPHGKATKPLSTAGAPVRQGSRNKSTAAPYSRGRV